MEQSGADEQHVAVMEGLLVAQEARQYALGVRLMQTATA
jgi:hypothetical protein